MEPVAAACAMQWNVELDRGLRSQKPGSQWEAILKLGARLQQWTQEPPVSIAIASLFTLGPGQEQAFANAILMHLTEAFMSGNNFTRFCILKILLLERKSRKKRHKKVGLLTKERVPNYMEVLKQIKSVAQSGDHFARALAFWVIGCLAELASDRIDFCRLILEALPSQYEHEVQAAVFALGCFCEISEDFAILVVGYIHDLISAKETNSKTRIQAISVFARMSSSVVAALKAHETAKALMVSMSMDELLATIEALSKLALECSTLVASQVDLLLSYVRSDPRTVVRAFSLNCLSKLVKKAAGRSGIEETAIEVFTSIYECADEPPNVKEFALQALRKLFPFCVLVSDVRHLIRVLSLMESRAASPVWSERQPVLGFLVDIVCTLRQLRPDLLKIADAQLGMEQRAQAVQEPMYSSDFSTRVVVLACDQLARLACESGLSKGGAGDVSNVSNVSKDGQVLGGTELRRGCLFLGGLLVRLTQHSSDCGYVVMDSLSRMVETLLKDNQQMEKVEFRAEPGHTSMGENRHAASCVLRMMFLCIRDCALFWLSEEGPSSTPFVRMTELVHRIICASIPPHILMDSFVLIGKVQKFMTLEEAKATVDKIKCAVASLIEKMDFWCAYKAVTMASCHGLWSHSSSAIECFMNKAQSESTFYWLKALAAICSFERNLQSDCSLKTVQSCTCIDEMQSKRMTHSCISVNLGGAIARALSSAYAAESSLAAAVKLEGTFEFQRRLLSLRVAFIRTSGELLGLLAPMCARIKALDVEAFPSSTSPTENDSVKLLMSSIGVVASKAAMLGTRFKKLAVAFDVLRVSSMGIDKESANILSFASLGCSFFSFCVLCSLFIPHVLVSGSKLNPSIQSLAASVANDLYLRLNATNSHECSELVNFILELGGAEGSPIISQGAFRAYDLKETCRFIACTARGVLQLQERTNVTNPELSWVVLARGVHLCRHSVEKWLQIPWALPKHFFCTRPPVGMDVYVELMTNASNGKEIQIAHGHVAPFSVGFQIRNLEINGSFEVRRLCCALLLKSLMTESVDVHTAWNLGWSGETTVCDENELPLLKKLIRKVSLIKEMMLEDLEEGKAGRDLPPIVVCDVSEKGQGFASCLFDTSGLECGIYHFSTLAVCLDKNRCCWIVPSLREGPLIRITPAV